MSLLGMKPIAADDEHVVSVSWAEAGYWWWSCTCQRHEGYSKDRQRIEAAAERHALGRRLR